MEASRGTVSSSSVVFMAGYVLGMMVMCSVVVGVGGQSSLATKCSSVLQKVTPCLSYATGKVETPTKECCTAVTDIRETDPACLCFFIQQTHNGSEQIKSLGIQESRLLLLPSACSLKNATVADCPKLLGIPPTSPDYAIFTNTSTATPSSPATTSNNDSSLAPCNLQLPAYLTIASMAMAFVISF